jgi:hypothetical protein
MAGKSLIGALRVTLGLDSAEFTEGLTAAQRHLAKRGKDFEKFGAKMTDVGAKMSLAFTAPLAAMAVTSVKAAQESADAIGQVDAALASMGPTAGRTSAQLQETAKGLMDISLYDDDDILRNVTANLLTFGNVAGAEFDRAQLAAVNLSARLKTDLQSATIMVGKALNDPVKGLAALSRAGIQFSADQKQMIMSMVAAGDTAGAQKIMLGELERQFGGAAEAARKANPSADAIKAWNNLQEVIGAKLIPVLTPLIVKLTDVLRAFDNLSPGMQNTILVGGAFLAVIGPIVTTLGALSAAFSVVLPLLGAIGPLFSSTGAIAATFWAVVAKGPAILSAIGTALRILVAASGPIGLLITALGLAYAAWKNWDKIEAIVRNMYNSVKTWVMDKLGAVWDWLTKKIKYVVSLFDWMDNEVVRNSYVPDMVDGIIHHFGRLQGGMVNVAAAATSDVAETFEDLGDDVGTSIDVIGDSFVEMTRNISGGLSNLVGSIKSGGFLDILDGVFGLLSSIGAATGGFKIGPMQFPGTADTAAGKVPAFANGGAMKLGGFGGIDRNMLSMNGQPLARVSRGETLAISPSNDGGASGGVVRVMVQANDYFDARVAGQSGRVVAASAMPIANLGSNMAQRQMVKRGSRSLA